MKRMLIVPAAVLMLAGCAVLRDYHGDTTELGSPNAPYERINFAGQVATQEERDRCEAAGGEISRGGMLGWEGCVQAYADAGKACTDGSDCLGRCMLDEASGGAGMGDPATGTCQATDSPFGCFTTVTDGRADPALCVD